MPYQYFTQSTIYSLQTMPLQSIQPSHQHPNHQAHTINLPPQRQLHHTPPKRTEAGEDTSRIARQSAPYPFPQNPIQPPINSLPDTPCPTTHPIPTDNHPSNQTSNPLNQWFPDHDLDLDPDQRSKHP